MTVVIQAANECEWHNCASQTLLVAKLSILLIEFKDLNLQAKQLPTSDRLSHLFERKEVWVCKVIKFSP